MEDILCTDVVPQNPESRGKSTHKPHFEAMTNQIGEWSDLHKGADSVSKTILLASGKHQPHRKADSQLPFLMFVNYYAHISGFEWRPKDLYSRQIDQY
jgi:hypothetical protein